jgi:hypothetical protein
MRRAGGQLPGLVRGYVVRRYTILFYILLLTLVAVPVLSALKFSGTVIESLLAASLLAAIIPLKPVRSRSSLVLLMAVIWLAFPVAVWFDHRILSAVTLEIWTVIGLFAAAAALRYTMGATHVDAEHLYAALSAYLLAGVCFGLLYWALEEMHPGMFVLVGEFSPTSAIYFSFVTLGTLGYGDIVPREDLARGLAVVEGVGGQLFLAVLVARLVSLYKKVGPSTEPPQTEDVKRNRVAQNDIDSAKLDH